MEKSSEQIEEDVYKLISKSSLMNVVNGTVYRDGMRPKNAKGEDVIVKFLSGRDGQEQHGIVLIHVYVPNIRVHKDGESVKDIGRIKKILSVIGPVIDSMNNPEYVFEKEDTPKSFPAEDIDQYFINIRISYKRVIF